MSIYLNVILYSTTTRAVFFKAFVLILLWQAAKSKFKSYMQEIMIYLFLSHEHRNNPSLFTALRYDLSNLSLQTSAQASSRKRDCNCCFCIFITELYLHCWFQLVFSLFYLNSRWMLEKNDMKISSRKIVLFGSNLLWMTWKKSLR